MSAVKRLAQFLAVVLGAWLQVSWFGHVRPLGVMPNVVLIVVVLFGLWSDATTALAAGLGGGFLLDLASGSDFGLRMAFYVVVALALIAGKQLGLHAESLVTSALAVIIGTLIYNLAVLATLSVPLLSGVVVSRVGAELVDNLVLLGLVTLIRLNLPHQRSRTTLELGKGLDG
jgi:rod shape-determining protein MreD